LFVCACKGTHLLLYKGIKCSFFGGDSFPNGQKPRFCAKNPPLCDNTPPHIGGKSIPLQRNKQETSGEMTRKRLTQKK
jgi:hypothetical protein